MAEQKWKAMHSRWQGGYVVVKWITKVDLRFDKDINGNPAIWDSEDSAQARADQLNANEGEGK